MANDLSPEDMRSVWQSQAEESRRMSSNEIRTAAERYQKRVIWRNVREYLGCAIVVAGFGWFAWHAPSTTARVGHLLVIVGALYVALQLHLSGSSRTVPSEMGRMDGIAFHRRELERQLRVYQLAWRWVLALVPGITVLMAGTTKAKPRVHMPAGPLAPLLVVLGGWVLIIVWLRKRNQAKARNIQRELERLAVEERAS